MRKLLSIDQRSLMYRTVNTRPCEEEDGPINDGSGTATTEGDLNRVISVILKWLSQGLNLPLTPYPWFSAAPGRLGKKLALEVES
jgi:hypothetical protein